MSSNELKVLLQLKLHIFTRPARLAVFNESINSLANVFSTANHDADDQYSRSPAADTFLLPHQTEVIKVRPAYVDLTEVKAGKLASL